MPLQRREPGGAGGSRALRCRPPATPTRGRPGPGGRCRVPGAGEWRRGPAGGAGGGSELGEGGRGSWGRCVSGLFRSEPAGVGLRRGGGGGRGREPGGGAAAPAASAPSGDSLTGSRAGCPRCAAAASALGPGAGFSSKLNPGRCAAWSGGPGSGPSRSPRVTGVSVPSGSRNYELTRGSVVHPGPSRPRSGLSPGQGPSLGSVRLGDGQPLLRGPRRPGPFLMEGP